MIMASGLKMELVEKQLRASISVIDSLLQENHELKQQMQQLLKQKVENARRDRSAND